jgi:hypothetical protein
MDTKKFQEEIDDVFFRIHRKMRTYIHVAKEGGGNKAAAESNKRNLLIVFMKLK